MAADLFGVSDLIKAEDPEYYTKLVALDTAVLAIKLKVADLCYRKRTAFDFSEDVHYTKMIFNYWNIKRKELTRKRAVTEVTNVIYSQLPEAHRKYIDVATDKTFSNWLKTKARLRILMVALRTSRAQQQNALENKEAAYKGFTVEQVIKQKTRCNQDRILYQTLLANFHPNVRSCLSYILVPGNDIDGNPTNDVEKEDKWKDETAPQTILETIQARNVKHFGQAEGTPFTTPPLKQTFGYNGMTFAGTNMIGTGSLPQCTSQLLSPAQDDLERVADKFRNHKPLEDYESLEAFKSAIKKWRESASTSPSGRHLGRFKSLVYIDSASSTYSEENPDPGLHILEIIYNITTSAFRSGLSLPRWQNITTCIIEKIPGTPRINKLRVIHLYEADYNAIIKLVWQRGVVWDAHNNGSLNKAQAGSRPAHTCIEVVASKDVKYLNSNLARTPMAIMENDGKSCYDRIVASLALLVSNHFWVSESICKTVGDTLRQMKFRIMTAMGTSNEYYCHSEDTPIHGVGQCGTASHAFWLLISSLLFDCHQQKTQRMTLTDPTKIHSVRQ